MIVRRILLELGFEVVEAEDGQAALAAMLAREHGNAPPFDLAMVDWNMPVMDGIDLLRAVKRGEAPQPRHIVMCTTETEPTSITLALETGASEYVMKPFTKDAIAEKLALLGF
jgi:two-component system, chemotaxis family, chemotaxis protein CheY